MKTALFLLIVLLVFKGFIMQDKQQGYHPSKGEQLVNSILAKSAKIIKDKYNLQPCGAGAAMPGGPIQEVTLCFDTKYTYTKHQLRELLIKSAEELLNQVNENKEIHQFLQDRPFTIRNVEIIIYNNDENGREVFDPDISVARISQGNLVYRTTDINDVFKYKNQFNESYEEALKILSIIPPYFRQKM
jgi:hypothetical protein